jgi:hypothetical protein
VTLSKPPGRSRLLLALGLSVALFSATLIALDRSQSSADQASDTTVASSDSKGGDNGGSDTTDSTEASNSTDTSANNSGDSADNSSDNSGASADKSNDNSSDTTDTTGADVTTTTAPTQGNGPDGNINNLPLHDGTQKGNVFNPVPYGEIPQNTPQVVIDRPGSGRILPLNQEIKIRALVENFQPGFFSDPKTQYGVDPQRLNDQGNLQGHNHACIQRIPDNGQLSTKCDSFVVLEQEGNSNVVSGVGPPISVPGRYRVCVDDASGAHYVAVRAFAQQGGPVDCVRVLFMGGRGRR